MKTPNYFSEKFTAEAPFLNDAEFTTIHPHWLPGAIVYGVHFNAEYFNINAFKAERVQLPEVIARSVKKRQAEFFFGRLAARKCLATLGIHNVQIPIGNSHEPVWPSSVIGSISHAKSIAIAIACEANSFLGIGIDSEDVIPSKRVSDISARIISATESYLLSPLTFTMPENVLLTLIFSAKESLFKALFRLVRHHLKLNSTEVVEIYPEDRRIVLRLCQTLRNDLQKNQYFTVGFDIIGSTVITGIALRGV